MNVPQPPGRWRTSWPAGRDNYSGNGRAVTRKSDVARTGHRALPPRWASAGKTNAEAPRTMSIALLGWSVKQVNLPCEGRNNEVLPTNRTNGTNKTTFASPHLCDSLDSRAQVHFTIRSHSDARNSPADPADSRWRPGITLCAFGRSCLAPTFILIAPTTPRTRDPSG